MAGERQEGDASSKAMKPNGRKALKLLVVDDDRLVLSSFTQGLAQAGYVVLGATSGAEAVRICSDQSPDLVVMDVRMPGMSGVEAARIMRAQSGTPVFFVSAFDDQDVVREAVAEGGLGYLVKPVRIDQLLTSIDAALARAADIKALKDGEENLRTALQGDRNIGIAVGLVMERHRLSAAAAFEALRQRARSQRRTLGDIAAELVRAAEQINLGR